MVKNFSPGQVDQGLDFKDFFVLCTLCAVDQGLDFKDHVCLMKAVWVQEQRLQKVRS